MSFCTNRPESLKALLFLATFRQFLYVALQAVYVSAHVEHRINLDRCDQKKNPKDYPSENRLFYY